MGVHYSLLMSFAKVFFNRLQMPHLFSSYVAMVTLDVSGVSHALLADSTRVELCKPCVYAWDGSQKIDSWQGLHWDRGDQCRNHLGCPQTTHVPCRRLSSILAVHPRCHRSIWIQYMNVLPEPVRFLCWWDC